MTNKNLLELTLESFESIKSGFFEYQISLARHGNMVQIRLSSKVTWSFSDTEIKLADFPVDFTPKHDSKATLYQGAKPIGFVEARTTGLYLISSVPSNDASFYHFDCVYWI